MIYKCPRCDYVHDNLISLSLHFRRKHKETSKQLRVLLFHNGIEPTCGCGCGESVKFYAIQMGFAEYVRGHASRVHNNWGHNTKALIKSQDKRREQIATGEWIPWNLGETKETDERIASYGRAGSQSILSNSEECKKRSERMHVNRLGGIVHTLYGSEHSQWKGGVSTIGGLSRSYMFKCWTYPKLCASNFSCQRCSLKKGLEVHHDKERFAEILQKARAELGDIIEDFEFKVKYAKWVADYHVNNNVSGIVLCEACHVEEHRKI